jgi:hypothetical protein
MMAQLTHSLLRDPVVPTDLGGWGQRIVRRFRGDFRPLAALAVIPAGCGFGYQLLLDALRPTPLEIRQQMAAAAATAPGGVVAPGTIFGIQFGPMVPAMVGFVAVSVVVSGLVQGSGYYMVLRRANGQPANLGPALRSAARRLPAYSGWLALTGAVLVAVVGGLMMIALTTTVPVLQLCVPIAALLVLLGYLVVVFIPFSGVMFVERRSVAGCFALSKGQLWATLVRALVIGVVVAGYLLAMNLMVKLLLAPFGGVRALGRPGLVVVHLLAGSLSVPLTVFVTVATLVSYAGLRFHHDPATRVRTLASEIARP